MTAANDTVRTLRADLHLHSCHSGYTNYLRFLRALDCYSGPDDVYATAKARGMDLVTITDHDSIDGCLDYLSRHPDTRDFFVSEEIECCFPDADVKVHIGAYGITEEIHRDIQPLRRDVFEVAAYLRSKGVFFAFNHPFFFYRGQMPIERYLDAIADHFPGVEARNGTMLREHNELTEALAARWASSGRVRLSTIGGSDAHTLRGIGTTYTEAPGTTVEEFLASLHAGRALVGGSHGSALREAREIYGVVGDYWSALVGGSRPELTGRTRAIGLAFSAVSLPFEFAPLVVAVRHKRAEARRIAALVSSS
jgi:predicted metal-dependent phosphoesterase TrpH